MARKPACVFVETPLIYVHKEKQREEEDENRETVETKTDFQFVVSKGENSELRCKTLRVNKAKLILYYIVGILTGFGAFLLGYWYPTIRVLLTHETCSPKDAEVVVVTNEKGIRSTCKVNKIVFDCNNSTTQIRQRKKYVHTYANVYFVYQFLRYLWNAEKQNFVELGTLDVTMETAKIEEFLQGLSEEERRAKLSQFGANYIDVPISSFFRIFIELAANPFYVFQIFSCTLWIMQDYIYLSVFILVVSLFGLLTSSYCTRKQLKKIKKMVAESRSVNVLRKEGSKDISQKESMEIHSENLVPGDVILVQDANQMLCDAILLTGNCIVDESLLTGESVPVHKHSSAEAGLKKFALKNSEKLWNDVYLRKHVLFNGSKVMKTLPTDNNKQVFALVLSTGFHSLKGRLLRDIIHMTPLTFKFFRDSVKFIIMIGIIALFGFGYSVFILQKQNVPLADILIKGLDILTIAISPVLPIALSTVIILAERQLKLFDIFCTDLQKINSCGKIKLVCFDKTGTLTQNNLSLHFIQECTNRKLNGATDNVAEIENEDLLRVLASCHGLAIINDKVIGDPMDKELLRFSMWKILTDQEMIDTSLRLPVTPISVLTHKDSSNRQLYVWKQFTFEPNRKRMSVLVTDENFEDVYVCAKGSPESILLISDPQTIPDAFHDVLNAYTKAGNRALALAYKHCGKLEDVQLQNLKLFSRQDAEINLTFCGFAIFQNALKSASKCIINTLHNASIKTVMATGDHLYTAVSVGFECNLLSTVQPVKELKIHKDGRAYLHWIERGSAEAFDDSSSQFQEDNDTEVTFLRDLAPIVENEETISWNSQLVVTGDELENMKTMHRGIYAKLLVQAKIFARMSPDQKANVVKDLMKLGYCVCMCGDGANDCNALKAADVGISLSETEASVAAPFTSRVQDITCILRLICEGRGALVTAFSCFKFIALYSLVQFMSVLILFSVQSTLSDYQYLLFDAVMAMGLMAFMVEARSNPNLSTKRPLGRLFHPTVIFSVFSQVLIQVLFQLAAFFYVRRMSWYVQPHHYEVEDYDFYVKCYENTAVFAVSSFQYITLALVFAEGYPFRQHSFTNVRFVCFSAALIIFVIYLILAPGRYLQDLFLLVEIPDWIFSIYIVLLAAANLVVSLLLEKFIIPSRPVKRFLNALRRKSGPRNLYKTLAKDMDFGFHLANFSSITSVESEKL